jgi:integrase
MPRPAKGARLVLRPGRRDRRAIWVIVDRGQETSTGCGESDRAGADIALARYLTEKYEPPKTGGRLSKTTVADVVNLYLSEHGPETADKGAWIGWMATPILEWWGEKTLSEVNKSTCGQYVRWRTVQKVTDQTARHELKTLRAAIRYYHASTYGPLDAVPVITLPPKAPRRIDYWLTRKQVADRIRAARRIGRCQHIIRLLLIGVYSGTRPGAMLALRWIPSTAGGWIDLESETLHRRATGRGESKKRQPPVRIHRRLLPHLKRWKAQDEKKVEGQPPITYVVHYFGGRVASVKKAWKAVAKEAGQKGKDGPHICRHTAATWQMQAGTDLYEAAGYLGMSPETLWNVYGHHSPAFQTRAANAAGRRLPPVKPPVIDMNAERTNRHARGKKR